MSQHYHVDRDLGLYAAHQDIRTKIQAIGMSGVKVGSISTRLLHTNYFASDVDITKEQLDSYRIAMEEAESIASGEGKFDLAREISLMRKKGIAFIKSHPSHEDIPTICPTAKELSKSILFPHGTTRLLDGKVRTGVVVDRLATFLETVPVKYGGTKN